jgi:hypothetical protein
MMKKFVITIFALFFICNISFAQYFNKFSIFGGPMIGWQIPKVSELNYKVQQLEIPEFSSGGYLTLGGGGYIDIPGVHGLRVGAFGTGFTENKVSDATTSGTINTAKYSLHYAAISVEYVQKFMKHFDFTLGGNVGVGTTKLELSTFDASKSTWSNTSDSYSTANTVDTYTTTTFTFNPQVGIGYNVTKYMYLKLNAGYMMTLRGDWKLNDVLVVKSVPSGIKADGYNFSLGLNFGLFSD